MQIPADRLIDLTDSKKIMETKYTILLDKRNSKRHKKFNMKLKDLKEKTNWKWPTIRIFLNSKRKAQDQIGRKRFGYVDNLKIKKSRTI